MSLAYLLVGQIDAVEHFLVANALHDVFDVSDGIDNRLLARIQNDAIEIGVNDLRIQSLKFGDNLQENLPHQVVQMASQCRIVQQ